MKIFFISMLFVLVYSQLKEWNTEDYVKNDLSKEIFEDHLKLFLHDRFAYDEAGILTIHGKWSGIPRNFKVLFKEMEDDKCHGVNFDMIVCVPMDKTCDNGMQICYETELSEEKLKNKDKHKMPVRNASIVCPDKKMHGIKIVAKNRKEYQKFEFEISASIDSKTYSFELPHENLTLNKCFKIKIGSDSSIATTITHLNDTKIEKITPEMKVDASFDENGWADNMNNFPLIWLDMIPFKNKWLKNFGDYYKEFFNMGGGDQCDMFIKFTGPKVHYCMPRWIETGRNCDGGTFKIERNATEDEEAIRVHSTPFDPDNNTGITNECTFSITTEKEYTERTFTRDTKKSGNWNKNFNDDEFGVKESFAISGSGGGIGGSMPVELLEYRDWIKQNIMFKEDKLMEHAFDSTMTYTYTIIKQLYLSTMLNERYVEEELFFDCNGWILKTGYTKITINNANGNGP